MTRQRSYKTAAARRRADPLTWDIDDGEPIRLRASVDFTELADQIATMQDAQAPVDGELQMNRASRLANALRSFLGWFVTDDDQHLWEAVKADLDIPTMRDMVADVITEYTGVDPTQRPSSSDGSSPTSTSSTDGAPPAASTPLPSPSIEP
jgi:hypothetical protein